ncbi:DNA-binding response regulator [Tateyamaria omphalii]|uniref:DNA-binding response regulator n=2 Tax=Tateyamaria omphalii TaxID=299262 RepID=A0A1P8MXU2_9RHOB|nr:response regulator [Tateyamaria omphalii]APX12906.1 DNA-binding response regulator [Tateyamaria omphalii]
MNDTAPQILIVDDARDIREPLEKYLRQQGFRTLLAANATEARSQLETSNPALVVLDVMMPGENGLSLCRWLVAHGGPPVILLTAMAGDTDRIVGLELGADDYVVKPFNPRELVARIRAVLRRTPPPPPKPATAIRRFGSWLHDPDVPEVRHADGHRRALTSGENRLLGVLLDHPQTIMSRDRLLDLTKGRESKVYDRAIDNSIGRLRRKIETDPANPRLIVTEWGGGYRLATEVEDF